MDRLLHWGLGLGSVLLISAIAAKLVAGGDGGGTGKIIHASVPAAAPAAAGIETRLPQRGRAAPEPVAAAPEGRETVFAALKTEAAERTARNPAEALAWASGLSDDDLRQAARMNVLAVWAESDPRGALLQASAWDLGPASAYVRGTLLRQWAAVDFAGALDYAERQPPGEAREEMLGRLAMQGTEWSPSEAARMVAEEMAPGSARDEAAIAVVHRWALGDPEEAASWAASFPDAALRNRALREIAGIASADPR
ncbi:MAG TPA: hypothetical protein VIM58_08525 [Candidatus Methylacidiphilales bacterium]